MIEDRNTVIFYTTAVCNLNCVYCYIDKSEVLKKIDNILDESFKGDYYFNFTKKMFPDSNQLRNVEIWGGEPTIRLDRAFYTLDKIIDYYPNVAFFTFSTNFTGDHWFKQFLSFCDIFRKYPNRRFTLNLQLSIDGPEDLNDAQRGVGVTQEFTEHFQKFIQYKKENKYPENLIINAFFKPTLSSFSIPLLQTKEAIIKYYQFFENYMDLAAYYIDDTFEFNLPIPNTACPAPHTKEEGLMFANLCKLCREIEKENLNKKIFKYYRNITPYTPREHNLSYKSCPNVAESCGHCGMAESSVGLLPNNRISLCHNGFVDLLSEYKQKSMEDEQLAQHNIDIELFNRNTDVRDTNCSLEEFEQYERIIECYRRGNGQTFQIAQMVAIICYLASYGMIDEKYKDKTEAIHAARFIQHSASYCIRDNLGSTGSTIGNPMGLLKLLLNGAREYCEDVEHLG